MLDRRQLVHVEGLDELEHTLGTLMPREARNITRRVVVAIARSVRDDIRKAAPRDEGTLKKAIVHRRQRGRPGTAEAAVFITHGPGVKNDAFYWHIVEFGSVKMPERPYIRPVVMDWRQKLPGVYRIEFGQQFEKEMAKRAVRAAA